MTEDIINFLDDIINNGGHFLIEAEGKEGSIVNFINSYNNNYNCNINLNSEGIILLHEGADKWSIELRLYVDVVPPNNVRDKFRENRTYRCAEYRYRLNDNSLIRELFAYGYRLGTN